MSRKALKLLVSSKIIPFSHSLDALNNAVLEELDSSSSPSRDETIGGESIDDQYPLAISSEDEYLPVVRKVGKRGESEKEGKKMSYINHHPSNDQRKQFFFTQTFKNSLEVLRI